MPFTAVQKHPRYRLSDAVDVVTSAAELHQLDAENISLGGVFLKTTSPAPRGSPVRLRLRSAGPGAATIGLMGRVVHVIDEAVGARKSHPPGMGVQFDPLSPQTETLLRRFVDGLAAQAEPAEERPPVRFVGPASIEVNATRSVVRQLWEQSLSVGGLFAEGETPPLGSLLSVRIGPLSLVGEVVHLVLGHGAGVQLTNLDGGKREALQRFVDGVDSVLAYQEVKAAGPPLGKLLGAVRRLFQGIEANDGFAALGLTATATAEEISGRAQLLERVFQMAPADATPPQLARLEAAQRALARLAPEVLQRAAALRKEGELVPQVVRVDDDGVRDLLAEAFHFEKSGQRAAAAAVLQRALLLAPDDQRVLKRLAAIASAIDLCRAIELMANAEGFVQGVGMKEEGVRLAREAARLTARRDVRLRALRVLAKGGELLDATLLAEELLELDSRDPLALQALVLLYERAERYADAAGVGERLLRQRPGDDELAKRVKKIAARARR